MRSAIALAALLAVASAAPQALTNAADRLPEENLPEEKQPEVVLVREQPLNNDGRGHYHYSFEQSDGQTREETGQLVEIEKDQFAMRVKGSYSWVDPVSKQTYTVHYDADEYGFRPVGEHIPHIPK